MFAYCNNCPVNCEDNAGTAPGSLITTTRMCDGGAGDVRYYLRMRARAIGYSATVSYSEESKGCISVNLDTAMSSIDYLLYTGMSFNIICLEIAEGACAKYYDTYGQEFLLSDRCVAVEIEEHINAYLWSIDRKFFPNWIAIGFTFSPEKYKENGYNKNGVYLATCSTDIRECDVVAGGGWTSQASIFNYKDGIRDIYWGTARDPWANER